MAKDKKWFIGSKRVKEVAVHEGIDLVGIMYEDGSTEDFTTEQWTSIRSEEKYDDGLVTVRKHEQLMKRIVKELVDSRITIGEHDWVLQKVSESLGVNYREAISKLFQVKRPESIMLSQVHDVLTEE